MRWVCAGCVMCNIGNKVLHQYGLFQINFMQIQLSETVTIIIWPFVPNVTVLVLKKHHVRIYQNIRILTNLLWWYLQYPQYLTLSASDPCSSHNNPAN